ncbi:SCO7613 C-terminal domain-containing membrane protein [Homoserinimonas sp. A447]
MSTSRVVQPWSDVAIRHLLDSTSCPVCGVDALFDRRCRNCEAHLTDELAVELWAASEAAAEALMARRAVVDRVRKLSTAPSVAAKPNRQLVSGQSAQPDRAKPASATVQRSSATVQSVLAVAGAGLFAVAAIVFTFFNPELSDRVLRSVTVGLITILFLGSAWLLARRKLQFSAEAVGGLGMVFVALDVYAVSELSPSGLSAWVLAAIGTLVSCAVMVAVSMRARIRSWLWISMLGLGLVPAMLGYAGGTTLSATIGHLGTAFAALALTAAIGTLAVRFDGRLRSERVAISTLQIVAVVIVIAQVWFIQFPDTTEYWLAITAVLAGVAILAVLATRQGLARGFWSVTTGGAGVAAFVCLPYALDLGASGAGAWYHTVTAAAGAAGLVVLGTLVPKVRSVKRRPFLAGAFALAGVSVLSPVLLAVLVGAVTVLSALSGSHNGASQVMPTDDVLAIVLGLVAMAAGLAAFAVATKRSGPAADAGSGTLAKATGSLAVWLAALAGLTLACTPLLPLWSRIAIALGLAVAASASLVGVPRIRSAALSYRLPLILGVHFAVLLATVSSWVDGWTMVWAGIAIIATIAVIARTLPAELRFLHVGAGYAYALIVFATTLGQLGVGTIAMLCLTTSLGSVGAIAATFIRRLRPPSWYAILVATSVPFMIGVIQVVFERSGWTALSTGLIFLLALTLLVTRRTGLGVGLRAIAAGILVPSLAVVVVCLGAQVLLSSGSPVTLPVIAAIVALVLPNTGVIRSALQRSGIPERDATVARIAIEASALLTGAIAVMLALVREASGLGTTFIVLVILGFGAAATSFWAKRRYGWWVAASAFTGALWCLWALAGIDALEPYLLPPSLAAVVIGLILTARGTPAVPLFATGLIVAVAPILVVLAAFGSGEVASAAWRGYGLIAASWLLLALGTILGRGSSLRAQSLQALRVPTLSVAIAAGAAGAVQGVKFGIGAELVDTGGVPLVLLCFATGVAGALPAVAAARAIRSIAPEDSRLARTRWLYTPAMAYVAVATWTAIERDWFTIWAMWALMLAFLVAVVAIARRRSIRSSLPPVWFVFGLAFVTAIVAWSPRDLRVEWFSLPLGLFLLAAGALALRQPSGARTVNSWPAGWTGSWPLLAPGIVTTLLASIIATFTDPLTWRAILVIVIALVAILIGSSRRLAAPFLIGIIVLPIENVFVFLVQIGRGIESMPWWITLAVVGAVLLIIAVTYERRAGEQNSITARLRDLS